MSYAVPDAPELARRVLDVVERIPRGKVMAYGDIADYLGTRSARAVGAVMRDWGHEVPWHRVLMADGRPAPHKAREQLALLRGDGVPVRGGRVDMGVARWNPYADLGPKLRSVFAGLRGVVERPSRFRDDTAYWVGGREIAHFDDAGVVDIRLTRKVISAHRALVDDARVHRHGRSSDWVDVTVSSEDDLPFLTELAALAADAHR